MKTINAYQTSDGSIFATEEEALLHEKHLQHFDVIEKFLGSDLNPYKSRAQRSVVRNTVVNWILWKQENVK